MPLEKPCSIILNQCMNLKKNESCLIITDSELSKIGHALYKNSSKITKKSKLIFIPIPKTHGSEPPLNVAKEMLNYDVIPMPTTKSLSHTTARKNASSNGARIASMPGITIDMMKRTSNVDFNKIKNYNNFLISKLKNCSKVQVKTKNGTNVTFFVKDRKWFSDDGIYTKLEGKTNGTIICDASVGGLGKVDKKIEIFVKDGFIQKIKGGNVAQKFQFLLKNKLYKNNRKCP